MPFVDTPAHALKFGGLDLLGADHSAGWWLEAAGDDADFGNPQSVLRTILSFMVDGSILAKDSDDNREMKFTLSIKGTNSANLAAGESALKLEEGKANLLTWTPPDNTGDFAGTPCVFDVVMSKMEFQFGDIGELYLERVYTLTITALPSARAQNATTGTNAAPAGTTPSTTLVDACTSTTGWAGTRLGGSATPSTSGGAVLASWTNNTGAVQDGAFVTLTRTGLSQSTTTKPFVRIDWSWNHYASRNGIHTNTVKLNGTTVTEVARNGSVAWYPAVGSTLTSVALTTATPLTNLATASVSISVADITVSDQPQDATGARQRSFALPVSGSVRTQGNFAIEDPSVALGSVLLYTNTDATSRQPPLRPLRTTTVGDTSDSTATSGFNSDLGTGHAFLVPITGLTPGGYLLMARIKHASAATYTLTWQARTYAAPGPVIDTGQSGTASIALPAATYTMAVVGRMVLPTTVVGSIGGVRIDLSSVAGVKLDDAWLFNLDTGDLTQVECATGLNRCFIDAPSLETPMPRVTIGSAADRSDAYGAGLNTLGFSRHRLTPPLTNVHVITGGSVAAAVSWTYSARYHTHVAG